jgi:chromosomal replication initiation ATPase DnaA
VIRVVLSLWKGRIPVHSLTSTSPTLMEIGADVAGRHGITLERLRHKDRKQDVVPARREFAAVAHDSGLFSYQEIAAFMCGRDHAHVVRWAHQHREEHRAKTTVAA